MSRPLSCTGPMPEPKRNGDHLGKPTRKARRFARRAIRSGKGGKCKYGKSKGKIFNTSAYLSELNQSQLMELFPAFRAKGDKKGTGSGKGKGRKGNPRGPDDRRMRCHECGSEEHLVRRCPRRSQQSQAAGDRCQFQSKSVCGP